MKELLHFEFHKLKTQKSFYICLLIMIGSIVLSVLTRQDAILNANNILISTVNDSSFVLITTIFISLFVCLDHEEQTIKNIYARGYTKKQVYFSKLIVILFATTFMYFIVEATALIINALFFTINHFHLLDIFKITGVQYMILMSNVVLSYVIASFFKKNGSSIAGCIVLPMLVSTMLTLVDSYLNIHLSSLWISSLLVDFPDRMIVSLSYSLIYIIFFILSGMYLYTLKD